MEEGTVCPIFPILVVLKHWRTSLSPLGVSPSSSICLLLLSTFCFFSGLPQRHPPREGLITGTGSGKVSMHRCADVQQVRRCTSYVAAGKAACRGIGLPCLFRWCPSVQPSDHLLRKPEFKAGPCSGISRRPSPVGACGPQTSI